MGNETLSGKTVPVTGIQALGEVVLPFGFGSLMKRVACCGIIRVEITVCMTLTCGRDRDTEAGGKVSRDRRWWKGTFWGDELPYGGVGGSKDLLGEDALPFFGGSVSVETGRKQLGLSTRPAPGKIRKEFS